MRRMENILGAQVAVLLTAGLLSFSHAQTLHTSPHGEGLRGLAPAMRVATPKIRWQLTLPAGIAHGSITFSNNGQYLYFKTFGDKQGQVFKVEASTGNIVWQTDPRTIGFGRFSYSGVVVDEQNGRLYTTGTPSSTPYNQSIVAALNINTGAIIWVKTASDLGLSGRNLGTGNLLLHPDRTRLYVRDDNNPDRIVALDASNGNRIWTYNMPNNFDSDSWMLHRTLGPIWTDPVSGRVRIAFVNNSTVGSVGAIQDNGNSASLAWSANVAQSMEYHWWGNGNGGSAQAAAKSEARPAHSSKASSQPLRISPSSVLSCVLLLLTVAGLFCCATVYLRNGLSCQVDIPYCSCASQWAHSRWIPEFSGKPCHIHWVFLAIHKQNADRRWTKQHIEEVGTMRRLTEVMHRTAQRLAGLTDRALSSERFDDAVRKRVFNGKHLVSLMTCLSYIAWGFAQVPAPDQLTENSAQQWRWFVEQQGSASIQNSTARVRVGSSSLRIDTSCPFRTAVFVSRTSGWWDLSTVSGMAFWVYAENPNPWGFQGHSPWIHLYTTERDFFEIRASRELMNEARNQWREIIVPFHSRDGWTVHRIGNPDLRVIRCIEINTDTWDWQPYRYWLDGMRFNLPVYDAPGLVAYAGNNRVSLSWRETHYSNFLRYEVYRSTQPFTSIAGMTPIAQISSRTATRYVDITAVNGQSYYYAVAVRLANGQVSERVRSVGPRTPFNETDLQVVSIARTPRYPRYEPIYDEFTITEPSTGFGPYIVTFARRLGSGQTDATQRFPRNGDRVNYTAYVRNRGTNAFSGDVTIQWRVNGALVSEQRVYLALQPGETRSFTYTRTWDNTDPEIRFTLSSGLDERAANNSLAIHAKSVPFRSFVDRTYLEEFRERSRRDPRATTDDFIDWLNHHMRHFNLMFADAGSPKRVHYDVIDILEDDQPDPNLGNEWHHFALFPLPTPRFRAGDGYLRELPYTAYYEQQRDIDKGLLHEFGHQLGLIDLYRLNVGSHQNLVNGMTYREVPCLMNLVEGYLSAHSATAMTRWYNVAHGYYGQYLYDLPDQMRLRFLDRNGAPLAGAQITVYQLAKRPGYDDPVITNQVKFRGTTDVDGYYTLPNVPIDPNIAPPVHTGNRLRPNPFGYVSVVGWNGLFLIRVDSGDQTDWAWLSIVEANLAYWSGQTGVATFVRRTSIQGAPTLERITLEPNPVVGGNPSTGTLTISAPAPAGGLQVQLSSNNPNVASVPASVTVPAGQRTASFRVDTRVVASQTQVMITARLGNSSRQATLTVNPPALESLTLDPNTVVGGNPSTGRVALNAPAPAGGLQVQLSSNNPNVSSVPASVTVPAGQRSATFTVNTQAVASQTQVTITATLNGRSRSATLTVNPRPVVIERVEVFAPNPVIDDDRQQFPVAGRRVNVRITLREPAPYRAEVRLRSSHPSVLPTPDRVYFEVGQRTLEMSIDTQRVHQNTTVTVTASNNFSERSGRIQLYKTVIRDVVFNPNPVRAGNEFTVTITMSEHIPSGGYYITISNGNPNVIEIRPNVRAREGRQPPISDFDARARRGSVSRETDVVITFRGENGEVFRRTIRVRP